MFSKNRPIRVLSFCPLLAKDFSRFKPTISVLQNSAGNHRQSSRRSCSSSSSNNSNTSSIILKSQFGPTTKSNLSLSEYVWKNVPKWADKPMVTCGITGRTYSYQDGLTACNGFTVALITQLGLKKGDVLGLMLPNMPEYVIAIHGALKAGIIVTFINPLYKADEVYRQFDNADVKCCVTIPELLPIIENVASRLKKYTNTVVINTTKATLSSNLKIYDFEEVLSTRGEISYEFPHSDDIAVLPYSSGTTGLPKGVMLTHANLVVNIEQMDHPLLTHPQPTTDIYQERQLTILPFFHIYGFNAILNLSLQKGLHIITMPKFTPDAYVECLIKYKPTQLFVVPSLLLFLCSHPKVKPEYLISVKEIISGAASATKTLIDNFKTKFNHPELIIRQGYGMTELSPCALLTPRNAKSGKEDSVGKLIKGTEARVVDLNNGQDQQAFKSGELYIRGPQVMKGYWKNEKATKETIDSDGWLHTGDIAYYDDEEFFYIIDRTKELIKVKGNQVSPTELENLILQLPGVVDVAVVGIPDILCDEIPKAFVVLEQGAQISEQHIVKHVNEKVVSYKQLAGGVAFIDIIPRNAAGKILRKELQVLHGSRKRD